MESYHDFCSFVTKRILCRRGIRNQCLQKPMEESDFRKIEHELQMNLDQVTGLQSKGLSNQGWANTCLGMA